MVLRAFKYIKITIKMEMTSKTYQLCEYFSIHFENLGSKREFSYKHNKADISLANSIKENCYFLFIFNIETKQFEKARGVDSDTQHRQLPLM